MLLQHLPPSSCPSCPARTAARLAGSLGCGGGELLHCGSWDVAKGLVLVPAAEILGWLGRTAGSLGSRAESGSSVQGPKAVAQPDAGGAATPLLQAARTSSEGTSLG